MDCHRRECRVSMRQVDAFPKILASGPVLAAALFGLVALLCAAAALLA